MVPCPACGRENPGGFLFCGFCAAALTAPAMPVVQERKVVSILFCDLVGFTAASERADPEDVRARTQDFYQRLRPIIEAFGGTVEKLIGDAVMAVFGAPVAHEDDPERAVRAGLAIVEAIADPTGAGSRLGLSVRIGVNTGEVLVSLGSQVVGEDEVLGDAVNTAARIQSAAPVNGVLVGESTFKATERVLDYDQLGPLMLKGKSQPVNVWRAVAPRARLGSDVIRSMSTPLVGRNLDLTLLRGTFDKVVADCSTHLVTVTGEPGVGKSRLVAELLAYVDGLDQRVTWRQGRCLPYGDGITFWPLGEIVKAHAGIYESDSPRVAAVKLEAVLPESGDRPWLLSRLLALVGVDAGEGAAQEELFTAWRRFIEAVAEQCPFVLVVEDVHWADAAMLAFLEHLADWAQGVPLLIVCTARPELFETHAAWAAALRNTTTISLVPLSDSDTARLVSALLKQAVLPAETQQLLLERAGGNPLYAEEFVRMLRDRDLLDERGSLKRYADVSFPESIQALIAARLDTLPLDRKQLLQDASVIGKVFWAGSTAAMGARDPHQVEQALHELSRKELVRPARRSSMEGDVEYGFWHILVRDVAYSQIPRAQRVTKHLKAAAWLEGKAGRRVEDMAEVLAYHTGEALTLAQAIGDTSRQAEITPAAARYALLAGERALGLDTGKAFALLGRARELTPGNDLGFPLVLMRWADAARQAGRMPEAADAVEQAADRFQTQGDPLHAGEAFTLLSSIRHRLGEPGSLAVAEQAVALLEQTPGAELVAALAEVAYARYAAAAYAAGIETASRGLTLAAQYGLPVPGRALGIRGFARCYLGDVGGLEDAEQALELLIAAGKGRDAAQMQHSLAYTRWYLDGPAAASARFEQAEAFAVGRGLAERAQASAASSVAALVATGRLEQALERAGALLPLLRESGDRYDVPDMLGAQAAALSERGGDASEPAKDALQVARDTDDPIDLAYAAQGAVPALIAAGDPATARTLLDEIARGPVHHNPDYARTLPALARAAATLDDHQLLEQLATGVPGALPIQQHALATVQAIRAEHAGDDVKAAGLYADAAGRWERFTGVLEQAHALLGQGRCLTLTGDPAAGELLRRARHHFDEMGARSRTRECDALITITVGRRHTN